MITVFISYRREGGELFARSITEHFLRKYKNIDLFYDIESMKTGDFNRQIYREIQKRDCVILLLPKNALDRCVSPNDWVRLEIAYALKCRKPIIPLEMEGFEWPAELPEDINAVRYKQGMRASNDMFEARMEKLAEMIHEAVGKKYRAPNTKAPILSVMLTILLLLSGILIRELLMNPQQTVAPDPSASPAFSETAPEETQPHQASSGFRISEPYLTLSGHMDSSGEYIWVAYSRQLQSLEYWISDSASDSAAVQQTLKGPDNVGHRIGSSTPGAQCTIWLNACTEDGTSFATYIHQQETEEIPETPQPGSCPVFPLVTVTPENNGLYMNLSYAPEEYSYEWLGSNHIFSWKNSEDTVQKIELPEAPLPQWLALSTSGSNGSCNIDFLLISPAE